MGADDIADNLGME